MYDKTYIRCSKMGHWNYSAGADLMYGNHGKSPKKLKNAEQPRLVRFFPEFCLCISYDF